MLELSELTAQADNLNREVDCINTAYENFEATETVYVLENNLKILGYESTDNLTIGYEGMFSSFIKGLKKLWKVIITSLKKLIDFILGLIKKLFNILTKPFRKDKSKEEEIKEKVKEAEDIQKDLNEEEKKERLKKLEESEEFKNFKTKMFEKVPIILYVTNGLELLELEKFLYAVSEVVKNYIYVFNEAAVQYHLPGVFIDWLVEKKNIDKIVNALISGDTATLNSIRPEFERYYRAAYVQASKLYGVFGFTYNDINIQRVCNDILRLNRVDPNNNSIISRVVITSIYPDKLHYILYIKYINNEEEIKNKIEMFLTDSKPNTIEEWRDYFTKALNLLTDFFTKTFVVRDGVITKDEVEALGYNLREMIYRSEIPLIDSDLEFCVEFIAAVDQIAKQLNVGRKGLEHTKSVVNSLAVNTKFVNEIFRKLTDSAELNKDFGKLAQAWLNFNRVILRLISDMQRILKQTIHWYKGFIETRGKTTEFISEFLTIYIDAFKGDNDEK